MPKILYGLDNKDKILALTPHPDKQISQMALTGWSSLIKKSQTNFIHGSIQEIDPWTILMALFMVR